MVNVSVFLFGLDSCQCQCAQLICFPNLRPRSHRTRRQICMQICVQTLWCCLQPVWTLPFTAVCPIICACLLKVLRALCERGPSIFSQKVFLKKGVRVIFLNWGICPGLWALFSKTECRDIEDRVKCLLKLGITPQRSSFECIDLSPLTPHVSPKSCSFQHAWFWIQKTKWSELSQGWSFWTEGSEPLLTKTPGSACELFPFFLPGSQR